MRIDTGNADYIAATYYQMLSQQKSGNVVHIKYEKMDDRINRKAEEE